MRIRLPLLFLVMLAMTFLTINAQAQSIRLGSGISSSTSYFDLLEDPKVQEELKIGDEIMDEINELNQELRGEVRVVFQAMGRGGGTREGIESVRDEIGELYEKFNETILEQLSEDQVVRIKQLQRQKLLNSGVAKALAGKVGDELELTDDQMKALKQKELETKEWERKEIARIRAEAQKEIISSLSEELIKQLKELTGEKFEFTEETRRGLRSGAGIGGGGLRLPGRN